METTRRAAGLGLLAYGLGTAFAFMSIESPGGEYSDKTVTDYIASGHWAVAIVLAYVGAFASLGLLVFANGMRRELRSDGNMLWGLAVAGAAAGVVGWFLVGGVAVAFAEGGSALNSVAHPAIYLTTEISNLVAICASAFFIGAAAIVLAAQGVLPKAARVASYVAGVCGLLAAFFFPLFLFWLWAIGLGGWLALQARSTAPAPAQAQLA